MSEEARDLEPPVLLIAMPQVLDPFFHRSVVLLIHNDDEGSFGLITNRATGIKVAEILSGMEISWGGGDEVAFFGGPVQPQMGTLMFDAEAVADRSESADETSSLVAPGVRLTQNVTDLGEMAERPPERMRLYLGYAGWGGGQLVDEILRNDWLTAPVDERLIFTDDPETAWERALESVGVDPDALPSWTATEPGASTN
ncbi:MAG: YqgE/AlgH family protein [Planctomycetota bacterium]|jgi:putative transcriptional regulator